MLIYKHSPIHRTLASRKLYKAEEEWYARQRRLAAGKPTVADTLSVAHSHIKKSRTSNQTDGGSAEVNITGQISSANTISPADESHAQNHTSDRSPHGKVTMHAAMGPTALLALPQAPPSIGTVVNPWAYPPPHVKSANAASSNPSPQTTDPTVTANGTPKQPGVFEARLDGTLFKSTYKPRQNNSTPRSTPKSIQGGDSEERPKVARSKDGCMACRNRRIKVGHPNLYHH